MKCGCTTNTCGCCDGVQILTPLSTENRPGLPAISYRAGTHGAFFETMQARLGSMGVAITNPITGLTTNYTPLTGLTTRNPSDPSIAMLDAWATVGDVLCFYQERIANEGYLGTATELQSVANLAYLVGYQPQPGVSASVYLAFTVDSNQTAPTDVPVGTQAQSVPGPGQMPQTFETMVDFEARVEWNNLQVQTSQPQSIQMSNALTLTDIYVSGTATGLNPGDLLLLLFSVDASQAVIRVVDQIVPDYTNSITDIQLQPVDSTGLNAYPLMSTLYNALVASDPNSDVTADVGGTVTYFLLGGIVDPEGLASFISDIDSNLSPAGQAAVNAFVTALGEFHIGEKKFAEFVYPSQQSIIQSLTEPMNVQAKSSADLQRSYSQTFAEGADVHPRILELFAPALAGTLYTALANAEFQTQPQGLVGLYSFANQSPLFGSTAPLIPTVETDGSIKFSDWTVSEPDTLKNTLYLGQPNDSVVKQSYVLIQDDYAGSRQIQQVQDARSVQRNTFNVAAKTTQLTLVPAGLDGVPPPDWNTTPIGMGDIRQTLVFNQTQPQTTVNIPVTDDVSGNTIDLAQVYNDLQSGRYVVLTGERTDIVGVSGVYASELLMVASIVQTLDSSLPGDTLHTQLVLATPMAYTYLRSSVTINANVVPATNGATKNEILGSGNGSQVLQSFTLLQPPLTYVSSPTPSGATDTLKVYVNGVQWLEAPSLAVLGPKDHSYIVQTNAGQSTVTFGDGVTGARLPTGVQNITAIYRSGIGSAGNVNAGQITLMATAPLGIQSVVNGTAASGGADPEGISSARVNAPMAVMALDRLVSIVDYADFARTFAGIGKATSIRISNGIQQLVHVTIAGAEDNPIDETSDLYLNLVAALQDYGEVDLPLQVDPRELLVLVLSANVSMNPLYQWDLVSAQITSQILAQFGFDNRCLGQSVALSQVTSAIQSVPGVDYVSIQTFGGIPEKQLVDGVRQILTPDQISQAALRITKPEYRVVANLAAFEQGVIRPAQLAMFSPTIPETIILNQIS